MTGGHEENGKVLMDGGGGLQSDMAFSPHGEVEVTVFSFENQSRYS